MGALEVAGLRYAMPGGSDLFRDAGFRVGDGEHIALIGANGTGKTTLLRLIAGELTPNKGTVRVSGELRYMRQLLGGAETAVSVRDLLVSLSPRAIRTAAQVLASTEARFGETPTDAVGMALARAHQAWGDAGGWDAEIAFDTCTTIALRASYEAVADRRLSTLSGGEQKRLALEYLVRSDADVLLLDEPDNFLDVPAKEWLEDTLNACDKTILFVSHDRELLARVATKIVTLEGLVTWTHGDTFGTYHQVRDARLERIDEEHRRYLEQRKKLEAELTEYRRRAQRSDVFASRVRAAKTKIERHEQAAPRDRVEQQQIDIRLGGDRTAKRAVVCESLELSGLTDPFDAEVWFGERVGIIGHNGTGKSHFLRLLAGEAIEHEGACRLGSRVVPGYFNQMHEQPALSECSLLEALLDRGQARGAAMANLRRYELHGCWEQPFATLSGGQQARFQVLLLEHSGATLLLLDEPTDNLDLASADALEAAISQFQGTVIMVTHDRWLMRSCDRFLIFGRDCAVRESDEPLYR